MNTQIIKPIIAAWLVLAASSLQAWQGGETAGGNTAESEIDKDLRYRSPVVVDLLTQLKCSVNAWKTLFPVET